MGLDTSHDCWHGSYGAFSRWRDNLADAAGYTFHQGEYGRQAPDVDWGSIERTIGRELTGKWPSIPVRHDGTPDPLIILIAHSDCDGFIQKKFLIPLAERLEELLPKVRDMDGGGHVGNMGEKTQTFIDGLRRAHAAGEKVTFH